MFAWRAATGRKGVTDILDSRSFKADDDNDLEADDKTLRGSILAKPPGWCREGCVIYNHSRPPINVAGRGLRLELRSGSGTSSVNPRSPRKGTFLVTQKDKYDSVFALMSKLQELQYGSIDHDTHRIPN